MTPTLTSDCNGLMKEYLRQTPTARKVLGILEKENMSPVRYDHLAYRTFGLKHMGIPSIAHTFKQQGYIARDSLHFPAKHVRATWFSPPDPSLPRIFISEIQVEELTNTNSAAQDIIQKYAQRCLDRKLDPSVESLPWGPVEHHDFAVLSEASEYASWVLVNAYRLNHATLSVHRLRGLRQCCLQSSTVDMLMQWWRQRTH